MPRKRKPARLWQRKDGRYIILDGGKQISTGFGEGDLEKAEEALEKYIAQKRVADQTQVPLDKITMGEVLVRYANEKRETVKSPGTLIYAIKALTPFWAELTVAEISNELCKEYIHKRGVASSTLRREVGVLNAALQFAKDTGRIAHAPKLKLPKPGIPRDRWITKEEEERLLQHAAPHIQRFIKIAIRTGRRKTAITNLKWVESLHNGWVDLQHGKIHFLGKAEEETKKRRGVAPIPPSLLEEMKTWGRDCAWVISYQGQHVKNIRKGFMEAARRAGLDDDVTPHTLKHTAVTRAFIAGMSLDDAVAFFATSRVTLENTYRSYSPDALKNAAEIMDKA